ncbi:hypothetical protein ACFOOP_02880 [Marinicaulis aureus]|uniref:Uncharacterized protein n=1 Tax=Hyphococcus aureus TaxID=2666033 RepID=A0ABW1KTQ1_9PROT
MPEGRQAEGGQNGSPRILFPSVRSYASAKSTSRQGSYAAAWGALSAVFTLVMVQFYGEQTVIGENFRNQDLVLYLKVFEAIRAALFMLLSFLIWRRASFVSALLSFLLILAEVVVRIVDLDINAFSWIWGWALLGAFNGVRGARTLQKPDLLSSSAG